MTIGKNIWFYIKNFCKSTLNREEKKCVTEENHHFCHFNNLKENNWNFFKLKFSTIMLLFKDKNKLNLFSLINHLPMPHKLSSWNGMSFKQAIFVIIQIEFDLRIIWFFYMNVELCVCFPFKQTFKYIIHFSCYF